MAIYPYSFTMPPVNKQDIPSDGVVGEFLGISAGGVLDWLPVAGGSGGGDMLKSENLSGLADYAIARTNIGLGLTSSPEFANLTLTSPSLASSAPVTISQTWNNAAVAFTGLKVNAVSTASAAGSLLLDLQVGGVSQFKVDKSGVATLSADGVPQLRMISVIGSGSVFNGLTLETSISTIAGFLVNRSTGEVKIGGLSTGGFFPTFYSNNAERMRITSAGNVGIGTTAPTANLVVTNSLGTGYTGTKVNIYGSVQSGGTFVDSVGNTIMASTLSVGGNGGGLDPTFNVYTGANNSRFLVTAGGNVGIGTTAPGSALTISGALGTNTTTYDSAAALKLTNTTGNSSWLLTSGVIGIINASFCIRRESVALPALTIAAITDNVGIGTTSPTSKLQVSAGDVEVDTIAKGVILKSPDGTRYRVTVANGGTLSVAAV